MYPTAVGTAALWDFRMEDILLKKVFYLLVIIILSCGFSLQAAEDETDNTQEECTIGVAAGRATSDGRPLIWKSRDNSLKPDNELVFNTSYDISFLEITNAGKTYAWMGLNEKGFAILNSLATDLSTGSSGISNGALMRDALGSCVTVNDFQDLLDETNDDGRRTRGNFAVIDSTGAAAIFEISGNAYWKFDANDTLVSKTGFIIRTNYAEHGDGSGSGYERYNRSTDLIRKFYDGDTLNYRSILRYQMRDFSDYESNPVDVPFAGRWYPGDPYGYIYTDLSICRFSSISATVIQGIKEGEQARLSTMWTILGQPAASIASPYWPVGETPEKADGNNTAPLCDIALSIKSKLFDYADNYNYIDSYKLLDGNGGGLWTETFPFEDSLLTDAEGVLQQWRQQAPSAATMLAKETEYAEKVYARLEKAYQHLLTGLPELAETSLPERYELAQNFPNPFNGQTVIPFYLPHPGFVSIVVYDVTGRQQAVITDRFYTAGRHQLTWNAANWPGAASGVYFYTMRVKGKTYRNTRKFILIK